VEVWLPDGRWVGKAEDVSEVENGPFLLRQVIVASGFAGPLFGVNPKQLNDDDFAQHLESYRLIRIQRTNAVTGPGGPGDLAWIWPLSTIVLVLFLIGKKCKEYGRSNT
jgi:hypothetical protein